MNKLLEGAINIAIKKEEYSYKLYMRAYKKAKLRGSRLLFKKLAEQELKHKRILQKLDLKDVKLNTKIRFSVSKKLMLTPLNEIKDLKDILEKSMLREQDSYESYIKLAGVASGKLKKVFNNLAKEETKHKQIIEKEYKKMF